jgi:hypothetical protein
VGAGRETGCGGKDWPVKMEQTKCSEVLVFKLQTPVNHPEESIRHSEHGESLKSVVLL